MALAENTGHQKVNPDSTLVDEEIGVLPHISTCQRSWYANQELRRTQVSPFLELSICHNPRYPCSYFRVGWHILYNNNHYCYYYNYIIIHISIDNLAKSCPPKKMPKSTFSRLEWTFSILHVPSLFSSV